MADPQSRWLDPAVLLAALLAFASGFAQFGVTAALGDVAAAFGEEASAGGGAAGIGMATTTLGIGLAVIRLASVASLPLAGYADRLGRRPVALACCTAGLAVTATAALAGTFWLWVALVALARPLLTGTNAVAGVVAAEETTSRARAAAIAIVGAAYAVGTGTVAVVRGVAAEAIGFRGVFALALLPLVLVVLAGTRMRETPRFAVARPEQRRRLGSVPRPLAGRLAIVCCLTAAVGLVVGPVYTYLFAYGERVLGAGPGQMALLTVAAGPVGLAGLVCGRLAADRLGRRPAAAAAMVLLGLGGLAAYRGGFAVLVAGYLVAVFAGAAYTPSGGALDAEIFPTSVRATAAGWLAASGVLGAVAGLAAFGAVAELRDSFATAAALVSLPAVAAASLYLALPETRGMELEESAPEPGRGAPRSG